MNTKREIKEIVWYKADVFQMIEHVLKEKAMEVYLKMVPAPKSEEELFQRGELKLSQEVIEKLLMMPEEIFKHPKLEKIITDNNLDLDTFSKGLMYYSKRNLLNKPSSDTLSAMKSIPLEHNIMMLVEGNGEKIGQLRGYFYSNVCSKESYRGATKEHCLTGWCKDCTRIYRKE